jgi:AraC-like DNA-binding protein
MTFENMTKLPPVTLGYTVNPSVPVIPLAMHVSRAGCAASHAHPRGQLVYASNGVMQVVCGRDVWVVPPSLAVWIPPGVEHEVYFPGDVSLRNVFIDPSCVSELPTTCAVLQVHPLLRELILKAVMIGDAYAPATAGYRLMLVLLDELREARQSQLCLPMARDTRARRAMAALRDNPGQTLDLDALADLSGASSRTLSRLFISETGLTIGQWRKTLLLHEAIDRLGQGQLVSRVAMDLGYQSISAFITMFRQALGSSPGRYFRSTIANVDRIG